MARIIRHAQVAAALAKAPVVDGYQSVEFKLKEGDLLYQEYTSTKGYATGGPAIVCVSRHGDGGISVYVNDQPASITVQEAGKRGGDAVKAKYGLGYYSEIGKKGGEALRVDRGAGYYSEIGKKGQAATRAKHGPGFYLRIGVKGGETTREKGPAYFSAISKAGWAKRKAAVEKEVTV